MIKLLIFAALGGYIYFSLKRFFSNKTSVSKASQKNELVDEELVQDPYCHTFVAKRKAYPETIHGKKEFFCSQECANKFQLLQENN